MNIYQQGGGFLSMLPARKTIISKRANSIGAAAGSAGYLPVISPNIIKVLCNSYKLYRCQCLIGLNLYSKLHQIIIIHKIGIKYFKIR